MNVVDPRIHERIRGPAWESMRTPYLELMRRILDVDQDTRAELTTIYVKFSIAQEPNAPVYAVAWLKSAKNVVVGFSLPDSYEHPLLADSPNGMRYKGLTRYFSLMPKAPLPDEISEWARLAFDVARTHGRESNDG